MVFDIFLGPKTNTENTEETEDITTAISYDYRDSTKTDEEHILIEKRRRHQLYTLLDYTLSAVSYADFCSKDTIKIINQGKLLAECTKSKLFTSEFLLIPFFNAEFELASILKECNLNDAEIKKMISKANTLTTRSLGERVDFLFYRSFKHIINFSFFQKRFTNMNVKYSYGVNRGLEKTAENALKRFKTPVITPEILFITLMEDKDNSVGKIIKTFFKEEIEWYVFRFKLIKRIHHQETAVRNDIRKSEQHFAYLLKLSISELEFNRLIESELIELGVSAFRHKVVKYLLATEVFDVLDKDINKSIRATNKRRYSK
jgi:hypothetical protein|tara:strand:+ start:26155 stop:27105 length:951 start_codon:yes stop_codon:yes gene_type:complete